MLKIFCIPAQSDYSIWWQPRQLICDHLGSHLRNFITSDRDGRISQIPYSVSSHHIYSELRPDPRKCLQDHNKEWSEWNGKKDAKKYSLIIWNSKKIDINCPARYCWCNSRITIDSETDLVVDLSSTGHIYFLLSKTFFQISLPKEITTVTRSMTAAILTDRNKNLWLSAFFRPTLSITSNTAVF